MPDNNFRDFQIGDRVRYSDRIDGVIIGLYHCKYFIDLSEPGWFSFITIKLDEPIRSSNDFRFKVVTCSVSDDIKKI